MLVGAALQRPTAAHPATSVRGLVSRTSGRFGSVPRMPHAPRALFAGLIEDAALFPPGNAPMAVGLRDHGEHRASSYADLIGPFLCPVSRIDEMTSALSADDRLAVSLIVDVTGEATHHALRRTGADPRLALVGIEAAHSRLGADAAVIGENLRRLPATVGFLEVSRTGFDDSLDLVAKGGWQAAKYRTGGATADAFPDARELAAFLVACADRELPFKLTAGLHHAVRHTDDVTGFANHGVLNVLIATRVAQAGEGAEAVAEALEERAADRLVTAVTSWSDTDAIHARRLFRSFGCCGVTDPVDDLTALGLLSEEVA
jgi:hypothetical protein